MIEESGRAEGGGLTPRKCRAALALLGWTVRDLGRRTGLGHRPIRLWERGLLRDDGGLAARLHAFILAAGVEFGDDGSIRLGGGGDEIRDRNGAAALAATCAARP